jgi:hypothetical protein
VKACQECRTRPRYGEHPFCSRTCATLAGQSGRHNH